MVLTDMDRKYIYSEIIRFLPALCGMTLNHQYRIMSASVLLARDLESDTKVYFPSTCGSPDRTCVKIRPERVLPPYDRFLLPEIKDVLTTRIQFKFPDVVSKLCVDEKITFGIIRPLVFWWVALCVRQSLLTIPVYVHVDVKCIG